MPGWLQPPNRASILNKIYKGINWHTSHLTSKRNGGSNNGLNVAAESENNKSKFRKILDTVGSLLEKSGYRVTVVASSVKRANITPQHLKKKDKKSFSVKIQNHVIDFPSAAYGGLLCESATENREYHFLVPNINSPNFTLPEPFKRGATTKTRLEGYFKLFFPYQRTRGESEAFVGSKLPNFTNPNLPHRENYLEHVVTPRNNSIWFGDPVLSARDKSMVRFLTDIAI